MSLPPASRSHSYLYPPPPADPLFLHNPAPPPSLLFSQIWATFLLLLFLPDISANVPSSPTTLPLSPPSPRSLLGLLPSTSSTDRSLPSWIFCKVGDCKWKGRTLAKKAEHWDCNHRTQIVVAGQSRSQANPRFLLCSRFSLTFTHLLRSLRLYTGQRISRGKQRSNRRPGLFACPTRLCDFTSRSGKLVVEHAGSCYSPPETAAEDGIPR